MKKCCNYVVSVGKDYSPNPNENVMTSIFSQYEKVVMESLITTFGLDFLIKDQHGGDVDTILNVRLIGKDEKMNYKNSDNKVDYENNGDYNSNPYHYATSYREINKKFSECKKDGILVDEYTGNLIPRNGKYDLDHVISAKEIHDDRGRVLAGLNGVDLANREINLLPTNPHTNRQKRCLTMGEYLEKYGDEYTEEQKEKMRKIDKASRKDYEKRIARAYYLSPKFAKDLSKAAFKRGAITGVKQAIGLIFAEIWFAVRKKFQKLDG